MPSRTFGNAARYGFNGKERDKDLQSLTAYDYGFRIYNPAIGRFLSVDPLTRNYPWYTPYQFAGNRPTIAIDIDGLEEVELHMGVQQWTDTKLQNQAKSIAKTDPQVLAAMQQSAYNKVLGELDAIVAQHFDPKHNSAPDRSGITKDVGEYFWNSTGKSSLGIWNSYYNYDNPGASEDELSLKINQDVEWLINNHFYAASAGTEFYYKYINLINAAKDPNTKAALMIERESVAKQRWQAILKGATNGFVELFIAAIGLDGEVPSGRSSRIKNFTFSNRYATIRTTSSLEGEVLRNYNRFIKSVPKNSRSAVNIVELEDGTYLFSARSPGNVPGSYALYQKWVNVEGQTSKFIKTTVDPAGNVVSVKPK